VKFSFGFTDILAYNFILANSSDHEARTWRSFFLTETIISFTTFKVMRKNVFLDVLKTFKVLFIFLSFTVHYINEFRFRDLILPPFECFE
jgi:hypothetical protein